MANQNYSRPAWPRVRLAFTDRIRNSFQYNKTKDIRYIKANNGTQKSISSRLAAYSIFKHNFESENYLNFVSENKYKTAPTRLRTSSHNLLVESGRYEGIPRVRRICKSCSMNVVEDEYHFVSVCPITEICV